ncbi:MAG: WYL domain-containing protein [Clostridiales bacterium]|nr:WYL domain-containing protein [Clostridiales bacterium]
MNMSAMQPKKLLILDILEILKKHTDAGHPLTQKQIIEYLQRDYGMTADRKAVKRNLTELMEAGYPVCIGSERPRGTVDDETGGTDGNIMCSDFYYEHEFSDGELRLLIDGLLFSKHIPYNQCRELIGKLESLSNEHFKSHVRHIRSMPTDTPNNRQMFYTIEVLDEAISRGKQVEFTYCGYGTDKKLHPHLNHLGKPRRLVINPYQMAATNGRYYLICNMDKHDDVANYRVDRITDIIILDTPVKPKSQVKGLEQGFDLPKHMAEHLYMYPGESIRVLLRVKKYLLNDIMDWFGKDVIFTNETDETVDVSVSVNRTAMEIWAMQYALHAEVLEPEELRKKIRKNIEQVQMRYRERE